MTIKKTNGSIEDFDSLKIKHGIIEAFKNVSELCNDYIIDSIINNLYLYENISSAEIRRQVEEALMTINKKVAKSYIQAYDDNRDLLKKQDFIKDYILASNAATGSKFDANANVTNKNIVTLGQELYKENNIKQNRYILKNKIKILYTKKLADQYIADLESHVLYKHDESGTPGYPYTYSSKEIVTVIYRGNTMLLPLDLLYNIVDSPEVLVDPENDVHQKYVDAGELLIKDKDNTYTNITVLTRKKRHRDLVRIKTSFGEDVVVTDNHPMITNKDNVDENTVEAINSEGLTQFKIDETLNFRNDVSYDLANAELGETFDNYIVLNNGIAVKRNIEYSRDFGYFVGFFVGDGNYVNGNIDNGDDGYLNITQNNKETLQRLNSILFDTFGIVGKIRYKRDLHNCYTLQTPNDAVWYMLSNVFKIQDKSWNKTLPINILETNEEFAKGVLEGLIDSDGTVNKTQLSIRLASRSAILQATTLLRHFGYSVGNTIQNCDFFGGKSYKGNYTIWGVNCALRDGCVSLEKSTKWQTLLSAEGTPKYKKSGETKITDVQVLKNTSFLDLNEYIYDLTTDTHSFACNNILVHNCVAITMFPFLTDGLTKLGGVSVAPTDLKSYCGEFINLVYSVSSQFMGAVATPEFLMYMDYFIRKDYGDNYLERLDEVVENTTKQRTLLKVIENCFQQVVHSMNMPAGNRGYQTVFWNVGYFDKPYFEGVFGEFVFPDGTKPKWETLSWLQKHFMKWFNRERSKYILTFPVETMALLTDGSDDFADKDYADFTAQMWADGHSFFCYLSDSPDSLSSCCRLRNSLKDNQDDEHNHTTHQYSMGTASVATGSKSVMSVNLPRLIQLAVERYYNEKGIEYKRGTQITGISEETRKEMYEYIKQDVYDMTERIHKYQTAFNETIKDFFKAGMLDVYNAGFIDMKKQYLTVGVNGITDAAEFMGLTVGNNEDYRVFVNNILETINICNKKDRTRECMFNTEFVPAENLAAKNYKWDKNDGFWVSPNRNLYSSYFYNPEDTQLTVIDKMKLHGKNYVQYLDGGSALHANLQEHLTQPQYRQLMKVAAKNGCNYFTFNVRNSVCNECGYISKHTIHKCPKCGSTNIDYLTRVIGYLKRISSFSEARQIEAAKRNYMTE